jgi:DNA adenine methylase
MVHSFGGIISKGGTVSAPFSFVDKVTPLVKRPGGKTRMLKHLLPIIGEIEHQVYVEPFCGGAAVLLAKQPSFHEVINDIDGDLINLYRQVKHHLPAVVHELRLMVESRQLFSDSKQHPGITEIQRAASFAYRNFYSFGGDNDSFGVKRLGFTTRTHLLRKMSAMSKRLNRVTIEHLSWERCMAIYDCPTALFFCDPPYTEGEVRAYSAWTDQDVVRLREALSRLHGRWIVTLNDCESNRAVFHGCTIKPVSTAATMSNKGQPTRRFGEIIITA